MLSTLAEFVSMRLRSKKVLLWTPDNDFAKKMDECLGEYDCGFASVTTRQEAQSLHSSSPFDVILADIEDATGGVDEGRTFFKDVRGSGSLTPFIFIICSRRPVPFLLEASKGICFFVEKIETPTPQYIRDFCLMMSIPLRDSSSPPPT